MTSLNQEYIDPVLVSLYGELNSWAPDNDFYMAMASTTPKRILDVGAGVGIQACALAKAGHRVVAIEPSPQMLKQAQKSIGADLVQWHQTDAENLPSIKPVDLAICMGHAFQVFLDQSAVSTVLQAIQRTLKQGGEFIFESRNPLAKSWENWEKNTHLHQSTDFGDIECKTTVHSFENGLLTFTNTYEFLRNGEIKTSISTLRYFTHHQITQQLRKAGFSVKTIYGDWDQSPFTATSPEMIFVAVKD